MKNLLIPLLSLLILCISATEERPSLQTSGSQELFVRIAEIEIIPEYLDEYLSILSEESRASVELEPGVISIFPMSESENPTLIRILEIYQNREAYEAHLETPHFKHYKSSTKKMVKSLKLIDMKVLDKETMPLIFSKMLEE